MKYNWVSHGDNKNPVIALAAPSNGLAGESGQAALKRRIDVLLARGFCVKVPQYEDGTIIVQTDLSKRKSSDRLGGTITPAVDAKTGANQIIYCIRAGWNIIPLMGGDNFEEKIPLIVNYFKDHPEDKNPNVKIFGLSNSTYATILASHGICSFISTPFSSIFLKEGFEQQAGELELVMKDHVIDPYPRKILQDASARLNKLRRTFHHPVNFGNIITEIESKDDDLSLSIENGDWSLGFEGFLQRPGNILPVNYPYFLAQFLEKYKANPPKFIEVGNIATRLDGLNGYANLYHDPDSGLILINEANIAKILQKKEKLKEDISNIAIRKVALEQKPEKSFLESKTLEILSLIPQEIFEKSQRDEDFEESDIVQILEAQNATIEIVIGAINDIAKEFDIPLILNTRNGHCANMSVVNGGINSISVKDDKLIMEMMKLPTKSPLKQSLEEKLDNQEKSFVEKMRSDNTKGKSQGGFNEL